MNPIADRVEFALSLAEKAAALALSRYQAPDLDIKVKPDDSLVTEGDFAVNDLLVKAIESTFGDDGILSEEMPRHEGSSGYRWVLDPIDGTSSYARGMPTFAVLIGIEHDQVPVAGAVALPAIGELLWGARGQGVQWRQAGGTTVPARVSSVDALSDATLEAASASAFVKAGCPEVYQALARAPKKLRGWSEGWAFSMVATGRIDAAVSMGMSRWDVAACIPLVEEAGGRLTGWDGSSAVESRRMIASNGRLHETVRGLLA